MRRKKLSCLFAVLLSVTLAKAQLVEHFTDGNFTSNPVWTGHIGDWNVNLGNQLQTNNTVANSSFYLSTANSLATAAQWEFYIRLNFNTSSANYVDAYLTASTSDLSNPTITGYFVRIGNTTDEVSLYRKDAGGMVVKLIDGIDGITNSSNTLLKVKVLRDVVNRFSLFTDATGTGTSYNSEGSVIDATYTSAVSFGFLVKQSTATFFQKHFFDDIVIQPYNPDVTPPSVQSALATSTTELDILFSEPVELISSQTIINYSVNNGVGVPVTAQRNAANTALLHLRFGAIFPNGTLNTITINGVKDIAGNTLNNGIATFSFYTPQRFDVVMDEIMADPSPQVALPTTEFIELKNTSGRELNLQGWRITTSSATSAAFPAYTLPADSFLLLTSTASASLFTLYGRVLGIGSFPALDNEGTILSLVSKEGKTIHALEYSVGWYQNTVKSDGGWSLEMVDTKNPCTGQNNWKSSIDVRGGSPGKKNSVDGLNADSAPPVLKRCYSLDSVTVVLLFDEPLDSSAASSATRYSFGNSITILSANAIAPLFNSVQIHLSTALQLQTVYTVVVKNITDCKGNSIGAHNSTKAGLSQDAVAMDAVINEILFNPKPMGFDYVEFYNNSNKIIDAAKLYIGNRSGTGTISSLKRVSDIPFSIFPGDYIVVTEDATNLGLHYFVKKEEAVLALSTLPSFPDNSGTVILTNAQGIVVDEVQYTDDWHFDLIVNSDGVALERIDPAAVTQDKHNWHSAAATAGYGTPGYRNSQYKQSSTSGATIEITPKLFSPDSDGFEDFATIHYTIAESGYVANSIIFDASGKQVRHLVKNGLLGLKGSWYWDGLGEKGQKLPIGTYLIYTELFNLEGKKEWFKHVVVLARKLN